jgi:hypothetical protein
MLHQAVKKIITASRLPLREKVWFLLCYPCSGIIRVSTFILPFSFLSKWLGLHNSNLILSTVATEKQCMLAWRIGKIIELSTRATPWEARCLVQAIIARTLLGYYNIPYVLYLGASLTKVTEPMTAHAWVKVGPWVIVGNDDLKAYSVISTYVSPNLIPKND